MYSPAFMKFLIGRDADDFLVEEKKEIKYTQRPIDNVVYRCTRYATIPIEIKTNKY